MARVIQSWGAFLCFLNTCIESALLFGQTMEQMSHTTPGFWVCLVSTWRTRLCRLVVSWPQARQRQRWQPWGSTSCTIREDRASERFYQCNVYTINVLQQFGAMRLWIVGLKAVLGAIKLGAKFTEEPSIWKVFWLDMTSNVVFVGWRVSTLQAKPFSRLNLSGNHGIHISSWKRLHFTHKVQSLLSMLSRNMSCQSIFAWTKLWAVTAIESRGLNVFSTDMFGEIILEFRHMSALETSPHSETIFINILGHQWRDWLWKELSWNAEKKMETKCQT